MITILKCVGCGGSDFKKHPLIDEYLECCKCGNQYAKQVRQIEKDLPLKLKVKIIGDHSKLKVNNCIIEGDHNKVNGNYNIIIGDHNKSKGENNLMKGDHNKMK